MPTERPSLRSASVAELTHTAEVFLANQAWCARVQQVTPTFVLRGIVGVFRCTLFPNTPDADVMVWVIVGDLPSAYIVHEPGDSWQDALFGYVTEMERWVAAARDGTSVDELIPVNVPPTPEYAEILGTRLAFLREHLLDVDRASVESDV